MPSDTSEFDTAMLGVTVEQFRTALLDAAERIDVVQPPALREPVSLWLRGVEERARREVWTDFLGRHVVDAWNAARAILATRRMPPRHLASGDEDGRAAGTSHTGGHD